MLDLTYVPPRLFGNLFRHLLVLVQELLMDPTKQQNRRLLVLVQELLKDPTKQQNQTTRTSMAL